MIESSPLFADGFGRRVVRMTGGDNAPTEHLLLDSVLANHDGFAAALRERAAHLHGRRLTSYARVHRVEGDTQGGLAIVSDHVRGWRLADLLDVAESENLTLDIGVVMLLLRQLLPTAALLGTQSREKANGALGPEHLLLTPQARLVITDYVMGAAIDALGWEADRLWRTLRVATPDGDERAASPRGDVLQVGLTVLSLIAGRRLRDDEFPERLEGLVTSARQKTPSVIHAPLSGPLRDWLLRALQLQPKSFGTLFDAQMALERLLAAEPSLLAQPAELEAAVARFERFMPEYELPVPEPELSLLEAPPPGSVPLAVAFDRAPPAGPMHPPAIVWPPSAPATGEPLEPEPDGADAADVAAANVVTLPDPVAAPAHGATTATATEAPWSRSPHADLTSLRAHAQVETATNQLPPPIVETAVPGTDVPWWRSSRAVAALVVVALAQTLLVGWLLSRPTEELGGDGELVVQSRPAGARVLIDDEDHGVTPITVRVSPGTHVLQVRAGSAEPRVIPLVIRAGVQTAQYVELMGVAATGVLEVRSEPSKARVTIDGQARGSTPLTLRDVAPGDHEVVLERAGRKTTQTVRVEPGATAQLVVPIR